MLKWSQPSRHWITFTKPSLSCLLFFLYHPYITHFLIRRICIYLYNIQTSCVFGWLLKWLLLHWSSTVSSRFLTCLLICCPVFSPSGSVRDQISQLSIISPFCSILSNNFHLLPTPSSVAHHLSSIMSRRKLSCLRTFLNHLGLCFLCQVVFNMLLLGM